MLSLDDPLPLLVTCARGLAPYLEGELRALELEPEEARDTGVSLRATLRQAYRLNLELRTAYHVLVRVGELFCSDGDALYRGARQLPWEEWIPEDGYVSVASRVDTPSVQNSMYPNLKLKDAIVDRIADRRGRRPDAGPLRDRSVVALRWFGDEARIYLDTSGTKLSDRGYRRSPHKAPLRETLAAGLLLAAGYDGSQPLLDPMCGSGTIAIEAALIASGRAPGLLRSEFGLKHLLGYDEQAWEELRAAARRAARGQAPAPIVASDRDPAAIEAARRNAKTAGVEHLIDFRCCDFEQTVVPEPGEQGGILLVNPEYGVRLGATEELQAEHHRLGDFMKQRLRGYTAWLLTGSRTLAKSVGLRSNRKLPFWNGDLECRLLRYELYAGSKKRRHQA